jgi:phosphatidylglycerol---prolipoprotein diacylglyceryl transferase
MLSFYFNTSPVAASIGQFEIRWYSLMYLLAITTVYLLLFWRIKKKESLAFLGKTTNEPEDLVFNLLIISFLGAIIGARLGYALFFNFTFFVHHPFLLFNPFENGKFIGLFGMSFHGGLIGAIFAAWIFSRKNKLDFFRLADFIVPAIPLGYFWGRIGNFLNGEILGKTSDYSLSVIFSSDPLAVSRHPVQLYEAFGEGILIFFILWPLRNKKSLKEKFLGIFLVLYGTIRFLLEFFRQPENLALFNLTTAQLLCLCMILIGLYLLLFKKPAASLYKN